jgi:hypothetical protein
MQPSTNSNSDTLEPDRPQYNRPAASVIAQQNSSVTFISMCLYSRKEKLGERLKVALFKFIVYF